MIEIVEYRPGKWVKVQDGLIVGRATAEEVAAWRTAVGPQAPETAAPHELDIDLDLDAAPKAGSPVQSLDVPLRPAFERRRRGGGGRDAGDDRQLAGADEELTVEMAIAREATTRRRQARTAPRPEAPGEPVMIRRRLPAVEPAAPAPPQVPVPEETPLPKTARPQAGKPKKDPKNPTPARQRRKPAARRPAKEQVAPAPSPAGDEPQAESSSPSYWWICNAHRQPTEAFLREWLPRYQEKFGRQATSILCHEDDLTDAEATGLEVEASPLLQPGNFYLSHEDGEG